MRPEGIEPPTDILDNVFNDKTNYTKLYNR